MAAKKNKKHVIVLVGRAGCGKGTFRKKVLVAHGFNPTALPMSDALMAVAANDPDAAAVIKSHTESGLLVPNRIVIPAFLDALNRIRNEPFSIIDGAPRDEEQFYSLRTALQQNGDPKNTRVIFVHLRTREAICGFRLHARAIEEGRVDDNAETIDRRMLEYDQKTKPFVDALEGITAAHGWEFFRFNGNNIFGSASMFLQMLHLPNYLKTPTA